MVKFVWIAGMRTRLSYTPSLLSCMVTILTLDTTAFCFDCLILLAGSHWILCQASVTRFIVGDYSYRSRFCRCSVHVLFDHFLSDMHGVVAVVVMHLVCVGVMYIAMVMKKVDM